MSAHDISSIGHNLTLRNPSQGWRMTYGIRKTRVRSTHGLRALGTTSTPACGGTDGDRRPRGFSCRDQFLCLAFAQLTFRESLRDIETCLRAFEPKLYHAGFRGKVSRSTLADANRTHDWRIFADFAQVLIGRARKLYCRRTLGRGTGADRLRPRQHHDRPLPEPVPLGAVPPTQGGGEAAHALGPARQHPLFRADFPRENPRRHRSRSSADRTGLVLRDGSRIRRFSTSSSVHDLFGVLRDASQTRPRFHTARSSPGRQDDGAAERSDDRAGGPEDVAAVPRPACVASRSTTPRTTGGSCS